MRPGKRYRGKVLLFVIFAMPAFAMMCAFAVDWGRVQMVKTELEGATHAAARYAITGIYDDSCLAKANQYAQQNLADGQAVTFVAGDVEVGRWDDSTLSFTPGTGAANAVRVSARRSVTSVFGSLANVFNKQVTARATVRYNVIGFGIVGLNSVTMSGNSSASYSSNGGGLSNQGNIASNGYITLGNSTTVKGNTFAGIGKTTSGGSVTGTRTTLTTALEFPNGDSSPYGPNNNDNSSIPSTAMSGASFNLGNNKSVSLPGGNYFFNNFSQSGGSSLTFTGPTTIYCYGSFSMSGNTQTNGNVPGNLKLVMVANPFNGTLPGSVSIGSTSSFYGSIYAPQSAVSIGGSGDVYGSVLGLTVNMSGTGSVVYDMALQSENGTLSLVE